MPVNRSIAAFVLVFSTPIVVAESPMFESSGALEDWDVLDFEGDARITTTQDSTCPPGLSR